MMATGINDLQYLTTYLIKLREPWSNWDNKQAIYLIHQIGQIAKVKVYSIRSVEKLLGWELFLHSCTTLSEP